MEGRLWASAACSTEPVASCRSGTCRAVKAVWICIEADKEAFTEFQEAPTSA